MMITQNSEKLKYVAKETLKSGIADFQAQFDHERLVAGHSSSNYGCQRGTQFFQWTHPDPLRLCFHGNIEKLFKCIDHVPSCIKW